MRREIIIHTVHDKRMGALVEDGILCEYWLDETTLAGQIVKGRVERYVPGMKSTFVSIGLAANGFLPMHEQLDSKPLQTGQEILVQIKKAPQGTKGAYLTQQIALPGETCIYLPLQMKYGVSNKIEEAEQRRLLMEAAKRLCGEKDGLIMRTNALGAGNEVIQDELNQLRDMWREIQQESTLRAAPWWFEQSSVTTDRVMTDYAGRVDRLVTDDAATLELYKDRLHCEWYQGTTDLFDLYGIGKQLDKALWPKVWLKSGGYLVVDACEAMTVIDVNTGKFTGNRHLEETLFKNNLEACSAIAQQARLRNLSGIILIDFIDMNEEEHYAQLQEALKEAFREDRQKTVLHGFTSLKLFEMTRKRNAPPLAQWMTEPCACCQGTGRLKGVKIPHE